MKKLILLFVVAISLAFQVDSDCNIRRSDVRLLLDEDAKKIYWSPKKTTIKSLYYFNIH